MRLGIKAKQIAGVTAIVGLAIVALSAINLTRLARVALHESQARGQLLANAIFHRAREGSQARPRGDLAALIDAVAWEQLMVIYSRDGQTLEVRQPMIRDDQPF